MSGQAGRSYRFVLVHGAWHRGSCWSLLADELARRGHRADAPDLPSDAHGQGALAYADAVLDVVGTDPEPVVLVGHSLGGLTVPVVADLLGPDRLVVLVLLAALTPVPGMSLLGRMKAEGAVTVAGYDRGSLRGEDGATYWPPEAVADGLYRGVAAESSEAAVADAARELRPQAWTVSHETTPLRAWPRVRTVAVVCTDDQVADPAACRRAAAQIGAEVIELDGGHFPMLTMPSRLADVLVGIASAGPSPG